MNARQALIPLGVFVSGCVVVFALLAWDECRGDPHHSKQTLARLKAVALLLVAVNAYLVFGRRTWVAWLQGSLGGVVAVLCVVMATMLEADSVRLQTRFDGVVVDRYRSENHGAAAVDVQSGNERVKLEYVASSFWDTVKLGDRVEKRTCGNDALLGGQVVRIFP